MIRHHDPLCPRFGWPDRDCECITVATIRGYERKRCEDPRRHAMNSDDALAFAMVEAIREGRFTWAEWTLPAHGYGCCPR